MKRLWKRTISVALATAMIFLLTACGGKGEPQTENGDKSNSAEQKEFVWAPEFVKLDVENGIYNAVLSGDYLYYENYNYDEKTETGTTSIASISVLDGKPGPEIVLGGDDEKAENDEKAEDNEKAEDGEKEDGGRESVDSRNLQSFMFDEAGNIVTVETVFHWDEETQTSDREFYICRYSAQGEKLSECDFSDIMESDENNSWVQTASIDGQGRVYVVCDSVIHLFDAEGNFDGTLTMDGETYLQNIGAGRDGKMYVSFYDRAGDGQVLREIDYESKKLGQTYSNFLNSHSDGGLSVGVEKDFMGSDGTSLLEYDLETQSTEKILDWLDCDINGNNVRRLNVLEDGRILALSSDGTPDNTDVAILTKKPSSEVAEKVNLVIGAISMDSSIYSSAVNFNKSSDKYHISIKTYFDTDAVDYSDGANNYSEVMNDALTRLNNDITSDNCPDMLAINNINISKYAAKGLFEDLGTYLDNGGQIKREDYFENLLEAYTFDGVLVAIPKNFVLNTIVGKAADLGGEPGWTLSEMLAYGDKYPEAALFANVSKARALQMMLQFNQGSFVDWETGKCSFDNENFEKILEFANLFPDKWQYNEDEPSYPVKIAAGEVLLDVQNIYDFESIQLADAIFGQEVNYIGYPNENGDSGTYLEAGNGLAITTKCAEKEAAWEFLQSWLLEKSERYSYGFPSNSKSFAELKEETTKIEYVLDENGEPVLDENGEPVVQGGGGGIGYGNDWSYEFHKTTVEEAEKLEELIRIARPATASDEQIMSIINEEAEAFFSGQKSARDVAGIIQSRVQVYVNENS